MFTDTLQWVLRFPAGKAAGACSLSLASYCRR